MKDKKKYFLPNTVIAIIQSGYANKYYPNLNAQQRVPFPNCSTECPDCFGTLKVAPDIRQTLAAVTLRHITRFMLHNLISSVNGVGAAVWPVVTRRR